MINLTLQAHTVGELHDQMRELLGSTAIVSPSIVPAADVEQPKQTAAQRKAAEKAAKEAAEKAAAEAAAAEAAKAPPTETEKQDTKDEAAEQKAAEPEKFVFNHDHVRKMLGGYVMAYGMENAQADGAGFVGTKLISELPDDQANFAKVVLAIANGIEKNPNKREIAGDGITAEKLSELKPIVAAALALK